DLGLAARRLYVLDGSEAERQGLRRLYGSEVGPQARYGLPGPGQGERRRCGCGVELDQRAASAGQRRPRATEPDHVQPAVRAVGQDAVDCGSGQLGGAVQQHDHCRLGVERTLAVLSTLVWRRWSSSRPSWSTRSPAPVASVTTLAPGTTGVSGRTCDSQASHLHRSLSSSATAAKSVTSLGLCRPTTCATRFLASPITSSRQPAAAP